MNKTSGISNHLQAVGALRRKQLGGRPSNDVLAQAIDPRVSPATVEAWLRGERLPRRLPALLAIMEQLRAEAGRAGILADQLDGATGRTVADLLAEERWRSEWDTERLRRRRERRKQRSRRRMAAARSARVFDFGSAVQGRDFYLHIGQARSVGDHAVTRLARPTGAARYVNTFVAAVGGSEPVAQLAPATEYELLVNIGRYVEASLLPDAQALWPGRLLPEGGVWLRATLLLYGGSHNGCVTVPFFLPPEGESYQCDCESDAPHKPSCSRRQWVRFTMRTPDRPTLVEGELVIYYQTAAVIAVKLELPVALPKASPRASVLERLTSTFSDLGKLAGRTASVVVSSQTARVMVNGTSFLDNPFAIGAGAADTSALNARTALFCSHFQRSDDGLHSLYDERFGKSQQAYEQDLCQLAREGAELYARLFSPPGSDNTVAFTLPALIRHEAKVRDRPPVLQIVDDHVGEHAMLWPVVYDLPVGGDSNRYRPCPAVRDFGPDGDHYAVIPSACPYEDEFHHQGDVLCPFGFWGLSCVLEQPPTVSRDLETVISRGADDVNVLAAVGGSLNEVLTEQHFLSLEEWRHRWSYWMRRLQRDHPPAYVHRPAIASSAALAEALAPDAMDVVYFYCHCGYDRRSALAAADRYLDLGDYKVNPLDIGMWARTVWADPHWTHRRPLVVLNGCHTTETTSGTMNSFVNAFTQWAGASGVLGTEVTLEQGLAGWAMEFFLARLTFGQSVGKALRGTRWDMLRRGNVMGLAYAAHCLANLSLRQPATAGQE